MNVHDVIQRPLVTEKSTKRSITRMSKKNNKMILMQHHVHMVMSMSGHLRTENALRDELAWSMRNKKGHLRHANGMQCTTTTWERQLHGGGEWKIKRIISWWRMCDSKSSRGQMWPRSSPHPD